HSIHYEPLRSGKISRRFVHDDGASDPCQGKSTHSRNRSSGGRGSRRGRAQAGEGGDPIIEIGLHHVADLRGPGWSARGRSYMRAVGGGTTGAGESPDRGSGRPVTRPGSPRSTDAHRTTPPERRRRAGVVGAPPGRARPPPAEG